MIRLKMLFMSFPFLNPTNKSVFNKILEIYNQNKNKFSLEKGLIETINWYLNNKKNIENWRYNSFTEFEKK